MNLVRLQKIIADRGYCSRRKAEECILNKQVYVDGNLIDSLGQKFDEDSVYIKINDVILPPKITSKYVYLALNKPIGVISTSSDDRNRKTVVSLIPKEYGRLFTIGRLDINTSGLIILTNDGEFANLVSHPSSSLGKTYLVTIDGFLLSNQKKSLENGIYLEDGLTSPAQVKLVEINKEKTIFELTIHEGRNRQVRRMVEAINHVTLALKRIKIGPIELGKLKSGEYREIDISLIEKIKSLCKENKANNTYKKK